MRNVLIIIRVNGHDNMNEIISEIPDEQLVNNKEKIMEFMNMYPSSVFSFKELKNKLSLTREALMDALLSLVTDRKIQTTTIRNELFIALWV